MPHALVLALFQDRPTAAEAAKRLRALGLAREDLSIVARTHDLEGAMAEEMDASPGAELEDSRAASWLGEISGYVVAAIAVVLPGIGSIVSAGPLSAEFGEAAGHLAGRIASVLRKTGLPDQQAEAWQSSIMRGALLLGAHLRQGGDAGAIRSALNGAGATEVVVGRLVRG
jgi:hypothetical protein